MLGNIGAGVVGATFCVGGVYGMFGRMGFIGISGGDVDAIDGGAIGGLKNDGVLCVGGCVGKIGGLVGCTGG